MPKRPGTLCVNNRAYRGVLDIIPHDDGSMTLVNEVPMDDYIGGVVTAEMPYYWPAEALKAQAVVARTYCLALILEKDKLVPRPDWDVEASGLTHQEYQGLPGEHPLGLAAVEATAGQVLMWDRQVFRAYFSSTCGGHTEACGLVWEDYPTIPPLAGGPCEYCKASKYYRGPRRSPRPTSSAPSGRRVRTRASSGTSNSPTPTATATWTSSQSTGSARRSR